MCACGTPFVFVIIRDIAMFPYGTRIGLQTLLDVALYFPMLALAQSSLPRSGSQAVCLHITLALPCACRAKPLPLPLRLCRSCVVCTLAYCVYGALHFSAAHRRYVRHASHTKAKSLARLPRVYARCAHTQEAKRRFQA